MKNSAYGAVIIDCVNSVSSIIENEFFIGNYSSNISIKFTVTKCDYLEIPTLNAKITECHLIDSFV